jgi:hypothetical protein
LISEFKEAELAKSPTYVNGMFFGIISPAIPNSVRDIEGVIDFKSSRKIKGNKKPVSTYEGDNSMNREQNTAHRIALSKSVMFFVPKIIKIMMIIGRISNT